MVLLPQPPPPAPHYLPHHPATRGYLIPGQHIELSPLEDRESVQVALSLVINALATGQLETKRATALLYGLQLASINSANLNLKPYAPDIIRTVQSNPDGPDLARTECGCVFVSLLRRGFAAMQDDGSGVAYEPR
jgi:hypothetical protein